MNYMINMDMVGRLNQDRQLAVSGTGTSVAFADVLQSANTAALKLKLSESGVGPSDHTSFTCKTCLCWPFLQDNTKITIVAQ